MPSQKCRIIPSEKLSLYYLIIKNGTLLKNSIPLNCMKRYYLIDHKLLFVFGYFFYFLTPYIVGVNNLFEGFPGMELYMGFFEKIPDNKLQAYALITFCWLPAFFLGHFCFKLVKPYKKTLELFPASPTTHSISYVSLLLTGVLVLFAWLGRDSLFGGYRSYDIGARGKMSTLLVIFNFFLLYQLVTRQKLSWLLAIGTALTAFLLLTMGGRMYVFQTFLIVLIYKTSFATTRWNALQVLSFAFLGFIVGAAFGIWRSGETLGLTKAAYSFFAEPVFTWFSTSTFLIGNEIPMINFPTNFLTSFLNLVPNTFFSLRPYVVSAQGMGYTYLSPLGADSVWSTYIINFGAVGSCFFIFLTGFLLNFLRHLSESSRFWAVYYILVCGMLPFQFFRDGFYIINKQLFFNFLLLPGLILVIMKSVIWLQGKMSSRAAAVQ